MKHKRFLAINVIAIIALVTGTQVYAQQELDKAHYKFFYEHTLQFDTLKKNDIREDLIILQVGQNISKSYSYYTFQNDSLKATPDGTKVGMDAFKKAIEEARVKGGRPSPPYHRRMSTKVYKNYPQGKMTVTDDISGSYYKYTDELHSQNWQITDSTKTILDYTCQMAVSDFRGRRWIAWFAADIPISDGPWKFSGLPGLIMEAHDSEKHYHFTIVGIESVENEPIIFSPVVLSSTSFGKYEKTTRIDFLRGLARYQRNRGSFMNAELGIDTFDESSSASIHQRDFIERDYR